MLYSHNQLTKMNVCSILFTCHTETQTQGGVLAQFIAFLLLLPMPHFLSTQWSPSLWSQKMDKRTFVKTQQKNPLGREPISVKLLPSYNCVHISPKNIECTAHDTDNKKSDGVSLDSSGYFLLSPMIFILTPPPLMQNIKCCLVSCYKRGNFSNNQVFCKKLPALQTLYILTWW